VLYDVTCMKLMPREGYIVVFKRTASEKDIDDQAEEVNRNGGSVKNRFDSNVLRVRATSSGHSYVSAAPRL
jgi:hypothetical protein